MKRLLTVRVKPGSKKRELKEEPDGISVHLTSPPEKGKANEELIEILSEHLGIAKSRIKIKKGHTSRTKVVEIDML